MSESYKVQLEITGANKAGPALQSVRRDLDTVGQSAQRTGGLLSGMQGMLGGLVAGVGIAGVAALTSEMFQLGEQVRIVNTTFNQLAGGQREAAALMGSLRDATSGIVTDMELAAGANRLMSMGLASTHEEVAQLTEMAVKLGGAMGSDATSSIESFGAALANMSLERLDTFGISSGRVRERMNELLETGRAFNREDAFRLAVLEQGQVSLDRLGEAAEAAATPLERLGTQLENVKNRYAEMVAEVAGVVGGALLTPAPGAERDALGLSPEDYQLAADAIAHRMRTERGSSYIFAELDPAMEEYRQQGAALVRQFGFDFYQTMMQENLSIDATIERMITQGAARVQEAARSGQYAAALDAIRERGAAAAALQNEMRIGNMPGALSGYTNELTSMMMLGQRGNVGGALLFSQEESQNADMLASRAAQIMRDLTGLHEQGIIGDEDVERFGELAERAGDIRDRIQAGADAMKDMTLDQALFGGTDANELLGGLAGGIDTSNWSQEQIDQLALLTGNATEASIALREAQEQISAMSPDDALVALQGLETITRAGAMQDASPEQLAEAYGAFQGRGFNPELMGAVEYASGIDLTQAAEDSAAIWDNMGKVATEVEGISSALDEVFDARYTLSIDPQFVGGNAQILQALFGPNWAQNVVRAGTTGNNGNVPGSNTDSNSRSTPPPTAPIPQRF